MFLRPVAAHSCPRANKEGSTMQTVPAASITPVRFIHIAQEVAARSDTQCSGCHVKDLCLPSGLAQADVLRLDRLMFARRHLKEGQPLYREGDGFQFLYAVRSGTFKSVVSSKDGREQ